MYIYIYIPFASKPWKFVGFDLITRFYPSLYMKHRVLGVKPVFYQKPGSASPGQLLDGSMNERGGGIGIISTTLIL